MNQGLNELGFIYALIVLHLKESTEFIIDKVNFWLVLVLFFSYQ
jgi:hypothetical protein